MADTAIHLTTLSKTGATAKPAGTAVVAGNNHVITFTKPSSKCFIRLTNTTASTKVWTITAGGNPPSDAAGQGVLDISLTDGSTTPQETWVAIDSARFKQSNGTFIVTVASSTTGNIEAFQLP